jgi:Rieske Fe-S protein
MAEAQLTRRQLLGALAATGGVALAGSITGCGKRVQPGTTEALPGSREDGDPLWAPDAKAYVIAVPAEAQREGDQTYPGWLPGQAAEGIAALRAACPNDGVRVSWCRGDRFFSCPGCASVYTRYGDWVSGPSPRGLDRFGITVTAAREVIIDRSVVHDGAPRGIAISPTVAPGTLCRGVRPNG